MHSLCGVRLKLKLASHVAVAEAYNHFLVLTSAQASGILPSSISVLHDNSAYARTAHKVAYTNILFIEFLLLLQMIFYFDLNSFRFYFFHNLLLNCGLV